MNDNSTNDNKEDPPGKQPPIDNMGSERPEKHKITAEKVNRTPKNQRQDLRLMAVASGLLVILSSREQAQLTSQGLDVTREALTENTKQFSATLQEINLAAQTASLLKRPLPPLKVLSQPVGKLSL